MFLRVDVGGETVHVFGRPEELAERLETSGYDIPANVYVHNQDKWPGGAVDGAQNQRNS